MSSLTITGVCGPADEPLVQMIVVTINGTRYALVGPVVHVPGLTKQDFDISQIEFGEVLPAHAAARMIEGRHRIAMGISVQ